MPLFEYNCNECDKDFTLLQSANVNKQETKCPDCGLGSVSYKLSSFNAKVNSPTSKASPVTADDLPNRSVLNLPLPRLRSEL